MAIYQYGDDAPRLAATAWVADSAQVIGRVELAEGASVWYGAVLRGDNEWIRIGTGSNVQDGCVLHTDMGYPLVVGERCSIGHQVMLHGCTVEDGALVGMGAIVLNGARIGKGCLVAAGALVPEGKVFEDGWLIVGAPAKAVRPLTPEQAAMVRGAAASYTDKSDRHRRLLKRVG